MDGIRHWSHCHLDMMETMAIAHANKLCAKRQEGSYLHGLQDLHQVVAALCARPRAMAGQ